MGLGYKRAAMERSSASSNIAPASSMQAYLPILTLIQHAKLKRKPHMQLDEAGCKSGISRLWMDVNVDSVDDV